MDKRLNRRRATLVIVLAVAFAAMFLLIARRGDPREPLDGRLKQASGAAAPEEGSSNPPVKVFPRESIVEPATPVSVGAESEVRVIVRQQDGPRIAHAQVFAVCNGLSARVGETDLDGSLTLPPSDCSGRVIAAKKTGYGEVSAAESTCVGQVLELILPREAVLSGWLVVDSDPIARGGVTVAAWQRSDAPPSEELLKPPAERRLSTSVTAPDGRFSIPGLSPGVEYVVTCAGNGVVSAHPVSGRPSAVPIQLPVEYVYALAIDLVHDHGGAIKTNGRLNGGGINWPSGSRDVYWIGRQEPVANLLGLDRSTLYDTTQNKGLMIARTKVLADYLPPIRVQIDIPGYELHQADVAIPLFVGTLDRVEYSLTPRQGVTWGSIDLKVLGLFEEPEHAPGNDAPASLRLENAITGELVGDLALWNMAPGTNRIDGIPAGNYECSFRNALKFDRQPSGSDKWRVGIGPDAATVTVEAGHYGTIEVIALNANDSIYSGKLALVIRRQGGTKGIMSNPIRLKRPPFLVQLVPEGDYSIWVIPNDTDGTPEWIPVKVAAGGRTQITVSGPE